MTCVLLDSSPTINLRAEEKEEEGEEIKCSFLFFRLKRGAMSENW